MPRKAGSSGRSTATLSGIRANLGGSKSKDDGRPSSYNEFLSQQKQAEIDRKNAIRAESTLKYGGGFGRKLLYGATKSLIGGKAADVISEKFRNKEATEKAYQTLVENNKKSADRGDRIFKDSRLERINASEEIENDSIEEILDQNTEILDVIDDITDSLDDVKDKQDEMYEIISKSDFLRDRKIESKDDLIEKLPRDPEIIKDSIKKARGRGERRERRAEKRQPKSYEEYLSVNKNLSKAEKTLRYGGTGFGRKALFGITKAIAGEGAALKLATLGRNKKQTEEAYQTIQNDGYAPVPESAPQEQKVIETEPESMDNDTESQNTAEAALKAKNEAELAEANQEWSKDVIERLDRIEQNLGGGTSIVDLIIAAIPLALAGLYASIELIKKGYEWIKDKVSKFGEIIGKKISELWGKLKDLWPFGKKPDDDPDKPRNNRNNRTARGSTRPQPTTTPRPSPTPTTSTTTERDTRSAQRTARGETVRGSTSGKNRPPQPRDPKTGRFVSSSQTAQRIGARSSSTAAKAVGKGLLKSAVKKIPIVGLVAGLGFAASRAMSGDFVGAGLEAASGAAGTLPGLGTAASVGLDATLAARDAGVIGGTSESDGGKEKPDGEPLPAPQPVVNQAKPQDKLEDILDPDKIVKDWEKIDGAYRDQKSGFIILPDPESLPLTNPDNSADKQLQNSSRDLEQSEEENIAENMNRPPTVVVNGVAPPPSEPMPIPPVSGGGPTIIVSRNIELSQSAYSASIFNHPVLHPGTLAF